MSSKVTLAHRTHTVGAPGFHLYEDALDDLGAVGGEPPVYLRVDGVAVHLETLQGGGAAVTIELPRELAREMGLLSTPLSGSGGAKV